MSLVFQWRSNTTSAYYAPGGELAHWYDQGNATLASIQPNANTGVIGTTALDMNNAGLSSWFGWSGIGNTPLIKPISICYRLAMGAAGTATSNNSLFQLGGDTGSYYAQITLQYQGTTGDILLNTRNEAGSSGVTNGLMADGYDFGDTAFHDVVLTHAGTTTALWYMYIDGVTIGTASTIRSVNHDRSHNPFNTITLGRTLNNNTSAHFGNEFCIFDHELTGASVASAFPGSSRASFYSTTISQPINSTDPGVSNVNSGTGYTFKGDSLTGTLALANYTDPGITNVRVDTSYIYNSSTLTGTLNVPTANTGAANTVPINNVKEQIRYALAVNNTATGAPTQDLSENMTKRVQSVLKLNPEMIPLNDNAIPAVTIFTQSKSPIEMTGINCSGLKGKRKAEINFSIAGMVYAPNYLADKTLDNADDEIEYLMENIERVLRAYDDLGGTANWQFPTGVTYHSVSWDEQTHFRAGIMDLKVTVLY